MTLCGLARKVGVTGRDVGHVGGVIPGKGNCTPGKADSKYRVYSAQGGQT